MAPKTLVNVSFKKKGSYSQWGREGGGQRSRDTLAGARKGLVLSFSSIWERVSGSNYITMKGMWSGYYMSLIRPTGPVMDGSLSLTPQELKERRERGRGRPFLLPLRSSSLSTTRPLDEARPAKKKGYNSWNGSKGLTSFRHVGPQPLEIPNKRERDSLRRKERLRERPAWPPATT